MSDREVSMCIGARSGRLQEPYTGATAYQGDIRTGLFLFVSL